MRQFLLANTEFEGRNSVYLLRGDGPTTLVDTGVATPGARDALRDHLADAGVAFADVERVVLTHWHYDHSGLAGEIQAESDCEVFVHEADAPIVAHDEDAVSAMHERQRELFREWGMPDDKRREILEFLELHEDIAGDPVDVTPVADGDTVRAGPHELDVVHLPGHAAGLAGYVFETEGRREAFVGDAILPKYTPNVGGADVRVDRPLQQYLDSLDRIRDLDLDRAWPGHRGCIFDPSGRARDIAHHHEERTERVLDAVDRLAPATPWEVSADLFGELHKVHIMHGPGEAFAHLDHLAREGVLRETDDGYVRAPGARESAGTEITE